MARHILRHPEPDAATHGIEGDLHAAEDETTRIEPEHAAARRLIAVAVGPRLQAGDDCDLRAVFCASTGWRRGEACSMCRRQLSTP